MENYKLALYVSLAVLFGVFAFGITFYYSPPLDGFEEFSESMKQCESGAKYLNEESAATWRYKIKGVKDSACVVEVTLLQPKTGDVAMEDLTGYSMECAFPRGIATYAERQLDSCHGRLKEELQTVVIDKLQTYVLENLRGIDLGLTSAVS